MPTAGFGGLSAFEARTRIAAGKTVSDNSKYRSRGLGAPLLAGRSHSAAKRPSETNPSLAGPQLHHPNVGVEIVEIGDDLVPGDVQFHVARVEILTSPLFHSIPVIW